MTESPFTVAPGSLRVEMDGLRLSLDREDRSGATYNALAVSSTFVTAGLAEAVDVQIDATCSCAGGVVSGAMFRWDVLRNDAENGYDSRWLATGYLQRHLTRALALYGEATLQAASTGASNTAGTLGVGALLQVTRRAQLDYEMQRGLNRRASEWTHVLRVNWDW